MCGEVFSFRFVCFGWVEVVWREILHSRSWIGGDRWEYGIGKVQPGIIIDK